MSERTRMTEEAVNEISDAERKDVEELSAPRARIIYEVVRKQGEEELNRPIGSLFWSGVAGGVAITASVIAEGALHNRIPADVPMREMIVDLGYSLGFLMVILGRMQLFTEQTIVVVLPNMADPGWRKLVITARLWAVVFTANMLGVCGAAAINVFGHLTSPGLTAAMVEVSSNLLTKTPLETMLQGIPAGFLIASVAWIRAGVSASEFSIIFALTATISLGGFTHVVAGSAEAFLLMFTGKMTFGHLAGGFILPAFTGNVIGGTGLFALLAHAQVRQEM